MRRTALIVAASVACHAPTVDTEPVEVLPADGVVLDETGLVDCAATFPDTLVDSLLVYPRPDSPAPPGFDVRENRSGSSRTKLAGCVRILRKKPSASRTMPQRRPRRE